MDKFMNIFIGIIIGLAIVGCVVWFILWKINRTEKKEQAEREKQIAHLRKTGQLPKKILEEQAKQEAIQNRMRGQPEKISKRNRNLHISMIIVFLTGQILFAQSFDGLLSLSFTLWTWALYWILIVQNSHVRMMWKEWIKTLKENTILKL